MGQGSAWIGTLALATMCITGCGLARGPSREPLHAQHAGHHSPHGRTVASTAEQGSAYLFLPGSQVRELVTFEIVNGLAIMEGDIVLGRPHELLLRFGRAWLGGSAAHSVSSAADRSYLWPGGVIPYELDPSLSADDLKNVDFAIRHLNQTAIKLRPRTPADTSYVIFTTPGTSGEYGCSSRLGRVGGPQPIRVSSCNSGGVVHEILHAAGFGHEHTRSDRDDHVTIVWSEITPACRHNFEKRRSHIDAGPYDFKSLMHYQWDTCSRSGLGRTIMPHDPHAPMANSAALSEIDRLDIAAVYGPGGPASGPVPPPRSAPGPSAPFPSLPAAWAIPLPELAGPVWTPLINGTSALPWPKP